MTDCTINVNLQHLATALLSAGTKDIRHYINGVLVEASPSETRCVGTDGHMLAALRWPTDNEMGADQVRQVIVPRDIAMMAAKFGKGSDTALLKLHGDKWELVTLTGTYGFTPLDGRFPDYRSVIPATTSGIAGHYDPLLIARFTKMAKALGKPKAMVRIHHNGTSGACVSLLGCDDEFIGVVMPLRLKPEDDAAPPSWASHALAGLPADIRKAA